MLNIPSISGTQSTISTNRIIVSSFLIFCTTLFLFTATTQAATTTQRVRSGDTVYSILHKLGFTEAQRNAALGTARMPSSFVLSPGQPYIVRKDNASARTEVMFFSSNSTDVYSYWKKGREDGGGSVSAPNFEVKTDRASGAIRGSLVQSLSAVTGDDLIAYRFMDAFVLDYDLPKKLQRGARFSLTYEKLYLDGIFIRNGEVLEASLEIDQDTISRRFVKTKGGGVYIDEKDHHEDRPFYSPVNYVRVSSLFQPRRFHPIKKYRKAHMGIDYEAEAGAPVYASAAGQVLRFGRNRAAGKFVVLRHKNGYETYYNHLNDLDDSLAVGKNIQAGATVGTIGCTGYCTKPHLHFALKKNGKFINPIRQIRFYSYRQKKTVQDLVARQ